MARHPLTPNPQVLACLRCGTAVRGLLAALLLIFCSIPLSHAASDTPDCEKEPACQGLWLRARELSQKGQITEAQRMYQMAYDLRADPRLLFNVARVLHKQGLTAEAAPYYQRFLDSNLDDPGQKQKARDYLEEIRKTEPKRPAVPAVVNPEPGAKPDPPLVSGGVTPRPEGEAGAPTETKAAARPIYKKWSYKKNFRSDGAGCWNSGLRADPP